MIALVPIETRAVIALRASSQYSKFHKAYNLATDADPANDIQMKAQYYPFRSRPDLIQSFKRRSRQYMDYSVLFFIATWGLNVADAAVDAHLKTFDVSNDLSLHLKAGYSNMAGTIGVSTILTLGK